VLRRDITVGACRIQTNVSETVTVSVFVTARFMGQSELLIQTDIYSGPISEVVAPCIAADACAVAGGEGGIAGRFSS